MATLNSALNSGGIKNEIARDLIAIGGLPFYALVVIRTTVGMYEDFISRLLISIVVLYVLCHFSKDADKHIARGFILATFTSLHYEHVPFAIFAFIVWAIMIYSLYYLKATQRQIFTGIAFGIISAAVGYFLTLFIV